MLDGEGAEATPESAAQIESRHGHCDHWDNDSSNRAHAEEQQGSNGRNHQRDQPGQVGATSADVGELDRNAQMYDQIFGLTNMGVNALGGAEQAALAADAELFDSTMMAKYGIGAEQFNQTLGTGQRGQEDVGGLMNMVGKIWGA